MKKYMNAIEKLYKNAGVKPLPQTKITWDCTPEKEYPPFTEEKQLKLIKFWLINYGGFGRLGSKLDFGEAVACCFNNNWTEITKEEKEEIREILK